MTTQRLSQWVALRCKDPHFWRFLNVNDEQSAVHQVRSLCGVSSRSEFDHDPAAAERCHEIIRKPFATYSESHQ